MGVLLANCWLSVVVSAAQSLEFYGDRQLRRVRPLTHSYVSVSVISRASRAGSTTLKIVFSAASKRGWASASSDLKEGLGSDELE